MTWKSQPQMVKAQLVKTKSAQWDPEYGEARETLSESTGTTR